jgi:hypothetical protein
MYKMLLVAPLTALVLTACVVEPTHYGTRLVVAPALPLVVELGVEPYYYQSGYHYHYNNGNWRYSRSRAGPWVDLPRSHYPREIRRRDGADGWNRGQGRGPRDRD